MADPIIEPLQADLLNEPLNFFFAEHFRHRQLCAMIDALSAAVVYDADRVDQVVDFLRLDAAVHIIDEEQDLFPLLRRRCLPEDELERVLGVLSVEHRADAVLGGVVRTHLEACQSTRSAPGLDPEKRKALSAFATQERRHLALENAVVLPIARLRLTADDLQNLGRRLAARRGRVLTVPST